jgi:hypothetical protein
MYLPDPCNFYLTLCIFCATILYSHWINTNRLHCIIYLLVSSLTRFCLTIFRETSVMCAVLVSTLKCCTYYRRLLQDGLLSQAETCQKTNQQINNTMQQAGIDCELCNFYLRKFYLIHHEMYPQIHIAPYKQYNLQMN